MLNEGVESNYSKSINEVINFILKHLRDDLSLEKLAALANYSPFHFQKVFKQAVGISPKQFIIKARIEYAGFLIAHQNTPITAIAADCGFSSPSVFSRSFRNYFGVSAEELRKVPGKERVKLLNKESFIMEMLNRETAPATVENTDDLTLITVKKLTAKHGISTNTSLQGSEIIGAFRKSVQMANMIDADISGSSYVGIINLHQNIYQALITLNTNARDLEKDRFMEIKPVRCATFKVSGQIAKTFEAVHFFYEHWLPQSGYQVSDICIYEILSQDTIGKKYSEIEREVYIPIAPA